MNFISFLNCALLFVTIVNSSSADETKDYDIFYDGMEKLSGDDIIIDLEVEKTGPTHFKINGFVEHLKQLDDDWTINLTFYKSNTNDTEGQKLLDYPLKGVCAFLKKEYKKYFYESLKDYSDAPHYDTCPLPAAKYTITNYPFDADMFKKFLTTGYFSIKMFISHLEEKDLIGYLVHLHIEEKSQ